MNEGLSEAQIKTIWPYVRIGSVFFILEDLVSKFVGDKHCVAKFKSAPAEDCPEEQDNVVAYARMSMFDHKMLQNSWRNWTGDRVDPPTQEALRRIVEQNSPDGRLKFYEANPLETFG